MLFIHETGQFLVDPVEIQMSGMLSIAKQAKWCSRNIFYLSYHSPYLQSDVKQIIVKYYQLPSFLIIYSIV